MRFPIKSCINGVNCVRLLCLHMKLFEIQTFGQILCAHQALFSHTGSHICEIKNKATLMFERGKLMQVDK